MHAAPTADLSESLELTEDNVEMVLDEIRPYLMAGATPLPTLRPMSQHSCGLSLSIPLTDTDAPSAVRLPSLQSWGSRVPICLAAVTAVAESCP